MKLKSARRVQSMSDVKVGEPRNLIAGIGFSAMTHFLWTACIFLFWRIMEPKLWFERSFIRWILLGTSTRAICAGTAVYLLSVSRSASAIVDSISLTGLNFLLFLFLHMKDEKIERPRLRTADILGIMIFMTVVRLVSFLPPGPIGSVGSGIAWVPTVTGLLFVSFLPPGPIGSVGSGIAWVPTIIGLLVKLYLTVVGQ
ncbi:hypothetical protein AAMO2058_001281600 [Amorphochlora amoebiformis]